MEKLLPEIFRRRWHTSLFLILLVSVAGPLLSSCIQGNTSSGGGGVAPTYTLSSTVSGAGSVTSNPSAVDCTGSCTNGFAPGIKLVLIPTPDTGNDFTGWSGACTGLATCLLTMSSDSTVTASFATAAAGTKQLIVVNAGGGTVTSDVAGINCGNDCSESYADNTLVTLTASPATGYQFSGWTGACSGTTSTCDLTMSQQWTATATFTRTDLCAGLVTDQLNHPMTALANPPVGGTVIDPEFGTTIRRITDAGSTGRIVPAYSTIPAWNADESYLILYHTTAQSGGTVPHGSGHQLYNGKTYQWIKKLNFVPPDLEQFYWDATDPDVFYYVAHGAQLTKYTINPDPTGADSTTIIHDFSDICASGSVDGGSDPMYTSWDSDVIGLRCNAAGSGTPVAFAYRFSTDTVGNTYTLPVGRTTAPVASASGGYLFLANGTDAGEVRDFNMNLIRTMNITSPFDHASLGRLENGHDTHNAVAFDGSPVGSLIVNDMTLDPTDPNATRVIIGQDNGWPYPPSGEHVSAVAFKRPGWVAESIIGQDYGSGYGQRVLENELVLANTNPGGSVCRVAHHRSTGNGYWAEPHVVISPRGTRLLFGSDWGDSATNGVNTYVVELPSYTP
ncbi:MAG: hypothetical protein P8X48_11500 [Acidiferrobacteraceae bacterium]|jgi:uncharacterized repeat protein (TIGR02543 family)